jgi:putative oxidoreductase
MVTGMAAIGRLMIAALFLVAGAGKIMGFAGTAGYIKSKGLPMPELLTAATIALEVVGGLLLIANRLVPAVALAFAAFCLVSGAIFHNFWAADPAQFQNEMNNFLKNVALAGALIVIAVYASRRTA